MALHTCKDKIWLLLGGSALPDFGRPLRRPGSNAKVKSAAVAASMNGKYLGWRWLRHGSAMARPWFGRGSAVARPRLGHGSAIWLSHGLAMARPWLGHGQAMAQSLPLHVRLSHGHECPVPIRLLRNSSVQEDEFHSVSW